MIFMQTSLRLLSGGTGKPVLRSLLIMINILKYLILLHISPALPVCVGWHTN